MAKNRNYPQPRQASTTIQPIESIESQQIAAQPSEESTIMENPVPEINDEPLPVIEASAEVVETPAVEEVVEKSVAEEVAAEEPVVEEPVQVEGAIQDLGTIDASSAEVDLLIPNESQEDMAVEEIEELLETAPIPEVAVVNTTTIARELSEEEAYIEKVRIDGTTEQKRMLAAVETFVQQLRPKSEMVPDKATRIQFEFLQHLLWIIEKDYEIFRGGWNLLLVYFAQYHGINNAASYTALSEFNTNRYLFAWTKGEERCAAYCNLITLLRATRNKNTRKHDIKTVMLEKVAPNVISANGLNNLKKFYTV